MGYLDMRIVEVHTIGPKYLKHTSNIYSNSKMYTHSSTETHRTRETNIDK